MTIVPKRLGVKFSLKRATTLQPDDILPIFQRWIQEHRVEGMLIDVVDYKHVPDGPGVVLIADEADYAYDLTDGKTGLNYIRKRDLPVDLEAALRLCFSRALAAAGALETEAPGDLAFDYCSAKISFLDRLQYRNLSAACENTRAPVTEILSEVFGSPVAVSRAYDDPRSIFALECRVEGGDVSAEGLLKRLQRAGQLS
ncbi:MAG: hypothetical protein OXG85_00590 [Chloroflexi bacterium]|nr:hypothetical protein [Chloroflexota bacterium]